MMGLAGAYLFGEGTRRATKMESGAQFSADRQYRYALWRVWDEGGGIVRFIGLNPSTADERVDDPTIRRCVNFARCWGFGGVYMLNIFAYRATDPKAMREAADPVGPDNDRFLRMYLEEAGLNIACWGTHGSYRSRGEEVIRLLGRENLAHLGLTKGGDPRHPLYLRKDVEPVYVW